ncbi:LacI family DNA-binding transcriptional regulator [Paracoccus sp. S3-43]|uniref:LacI family DNA-binding transcriptional regulator n=1 Tax=Paracoccus sp. S3-43 TaxID=3030011 RepID=UPI0023B0BBB3|nr:LacI family DNA-binding transcriptional regulator [Paracoccus sp. S3-43]WEF24746.1 LacI family DNA-binding transcriptional regulator [Paracoccus sp. S3-43]
MSSPNLSRVRIYDVANAAGVSIATASKALNGTGRMAVETRDRIERIAAELGFRPNALARGLISRRSFTVGLLTNDTYGRFTLPVMAGVSEALVDHGVSVFLCTIGNDPELGKVHVDAMLDKQVDGIIATGKRIDHRLPVDLADLPIPVVYAFTGAPEDAVQLVSDDAQGSREAVEWLARLGRSHIVHVTGPGSFASVHERAGAFRDVAGADAPVLYGEWSEAWGHRAVAQIWEDRARPPDGIFCGNDQIARGVVDALRERGVDVPGAVSVVGFDNWELVAAATRPPLTTVDMNLKDLGREAGRLILALAEGKQVAPGLRRMACRLVVRQSCGGAPAP